MGSGCAGAGVLAEAPSGGEGGAELNVWVQWGLLGAVLGLGGQVGVSLQSRVGMRKSVWPGECWGVSKVKSGLDGS